MIKGNGLVATRFFNEYKNDKNIQIFASGVSNSKTTNSEEFAREANLIKESISPNFNTHFVYFSTCSVYDPAETSSMYVIHKLQMESYIEQHCPSYHIFRVSNLVGRSNNKNTVLNFFFDKIKNNLPFNVWVNASRNLIDVDDMYNVVNYIIKNKLRTNQITNIANTFSFQPLEIVENIEFFLQKKANYTAINMGLPFAINTKNIEPFLKDCSISFNEQYLQHLLHKYYF